MKYQTGFFADESGRSKVHLINNGEPDCGAQIAVTKELQFVSSGVAVDHIDCRACSRKAENLKAKDSAG